MHYGRITTVVGAVLALVGLGLTSASSAAEELMPALNEATAGAVPAGFDRIFTSMWNDNAAGTGIFLIALVAVLGLSLIPDVKEALARMNALIVTVLGVVMLVVGVIATKGALDDASALQDAFAAMAQGGQIPAAFTVSISVGWYLLPIGGALAAIGAVLQLMKRSDEDALTS